VLNVAFNFSETLKFQNYLFGGLIFDFEPSVLLINTVCHKIWCCYNIYIFSMFRCSLLQSVFLR